MLDSTQPAIAPTKKRAGFTYGSLVDNRKDKGGATHTYRTIKLKDGKEWMAENFNFLMGNDSQGKPQTLGAQNDYDNPHPGNRKLLGLYYTWEAIQQALAEGWRLPTVDEWTNLIQVYGGTNNAYSALLNDGTSGLDLQLFSWRAGKDFLISGVGDLGFFWSGSEGDDTGYAALIKLEKDSSTTKIEYLGKDKYFNVRLIKA